MASRVHYRHQRDMVGPALPASRTSAFAAKAPHRLRPQRKISLAEASATLKFGLRLAPNAQMLK
jgi:hypothetical protein